MALPPQIFLLLNPHTATQNITLHATTRIVPLTFRERRPLPDPPVPGRYPFAFTGGGGIPPEDRRRIILQCLPRLCPTGFCYPHRAGGPAAW